MNVFITFLVGGGVILSGLAWIVDRSRRRRPRPPARNDWLDSTRSYPAEACCSTTSRCSRKRSREPTTIRSAACCAVADAREQADPDRAALGLVGLAIGVVGVLALREATLSTHERWRRATELVVGKDESGREQPDPRRDGRGAPADVPPRGHVRPGQPDRAARRRAVPPCSLRRWTRPTAGSSKAASRISSSTASRSTCLEPDADRLRIRHGARRRGCRLRPRRAAFRRASSLAPARAGVVSSGHGVILQTSTRTAGTSTARHPDQLFDFSVT